MRSESASFLLSRSPLALLLTAKSDDCAGHFGRRLDRPFEGDCGWLLRAIGWGFLPSELHFIAFHGAAEFVLAELPRVCAAQLGARLFENERGGEVPAVFR